MVRSEAPRPALATLSHEPFFESGWIYERKLDGERCLATGSAGDVVLWSRSGHDITDSFPEIAEELEAQVTTDFVMDGEIVAFEGRRTSFAKLQPRMQVRDRESARASGVEVWYYAFDLLSADGEDLRGRSTRERKQLLREFLRFRGHLRFTPHRNTADESYFAAVCRRGWEGLVVKAEDAGYAEGRSRRWLKFKCEGGQELVVGGFTDPAGSRTGFGALLLGYYRDGELRYAGKVGTGFDDETLRRLSRQLRSSEIDEPAFRGGKLPDQGVHWVEPRLVVEVRFTEWTRNGQLRHPRFIGLRDDKAAEQVVRE